MLERLRSGLLDGPGMNCRPHHSRQRIDLVQLEKLTGASAAKIVHSFPRTGQKCEDRDQVVQPASPNESKPSGEGKRISKTVSHPCALESLARAAEEPSESKRPSDRSEEGNSLGNARANDPYDQQQTLLRKLKIACGGCPDLRQDTGCDALHLGFPLLHVPKGKGQGQSATRRLLASRTLPHPGDPESGIRGTRPAIEITCRADKMDRVVPNPSLLGMA